MRMSMDSSQSGARAAPAFSKASHCLPRRLFCLALLVAPEPVGFFSLLAGPGRGLPCQHLRGLSTSPLGLGSGSFCKELLHHPLVILPFAHGTDLFQDGSFPRSVPSKELAFPSLLWLENYWQT